MKQTQLAQLSVSELRSTLEANAEKVELQTYQKQLTDEEVEKELKDFSQLAIEIQQKEDELDAIKDQFKNVIKPMKSSFAEKLRILRTKTKAVTESVYLIPDFERGTMETYSGDGIMISWRRLTPEERQLSIHSARRMSAVND